MDESTILNKAALAYEQGLSKLRHAGVLAWPRSYKAIAEILDVPEEVFGQVRRTGYRGKSLSFEQAALAWQWLCFKSRDPHMQELTGRGKKFKIKDGVYIL